MNKPEQYEIVEVIVTLLRLLDKYNLSKMIDEIYKMLENFTEVKNDG